MHSIDLVEFYRDPPYSKFGPLRTNGSGKYANPGPRYPTLEKKPNKHYNRDFIMGHKY